MSQLAGNDNQVDRLFSDICGGDVLKSRRSIAKAITLLESKKPEHRDLADALLTRLLPRTGGAMRIGISGVPGAGKSTFIEALGVWLIDRGHRVAVLAIDPSSSISGGSILGDKTRMERLSCLQNAYIRPSPSSGTLGGVASMTRESMLVCEAAGYDVVLVETVGVGQSETAVSQMTDMFTLLQLPNTGDDLQAIKKGVMELADLVVINKADIDKDAATRARAQIQSAFRLFNNHGAHHGTNHGGGLSQVIEFWQPQVIQLSALKNDGVDVFWQQVENYWGIKRQNGQLEQRRASQNLSWLWERIDAGLKLAFRQNENVAAHLPQTLNDVVEGKLPPSAAARQLLKLATGGKING